jgi:hypothetical protein
MKLEMKEFKDQEIDRYIQPSIIKQFALRYKHINREYGFTVLRNQFMEIRRQIVGRSYEKVWQDKLLGKAIE